MKSGIRRTTSRPGTRSFFFRAKASEEISATSALEIQDLVASSKVASVYSLLVHASSMMVAIAYVTAGSI